MAGLFDAFTSDPYKDVRQQEIDEESEAYRVATMTPGQRNVYGAYTSGRDMGRGLGQALGGAFGVDTRTPAQRNVAAIEAVKQQVAQEGIDPTDTDKFYPRVIQLLGQKGLTFEAAAMSREYQKMKLEGRAAERQDRELQRKELADKARAGDQAAKIEVAKQKLATMGSPFIQALNRLESLSKQLAAATDPAESANIAQSLEMVVRQLDKMSAGKVTVVNLDDRVQITDNETGELIREVMKGRKLGSEKDKAKTEGANAQQVAAYKSSKDRLQAIYNNVVQLANHPGLDNITGRFRGAVGGETGKGGSFGTMALSDEGRAALALLEQVTGQAFLGALEQLKSASKTGASGLGAVTETEGNRLIAASAALNRQQETGDFINSLKKYAAAIVQMGARMDEKAGTDQLVPLKEMPFNPAPGAKAPKQATPAVGGDDTVRVTKDGAFGRVKRSELEAAKADGWKEAR